MSAVFVGQYPAMEAVLRKALAPDVYKGNQDAWISEAAEALESDDGRLIIPSYCTPHGQDVTITKADVKAHCDFTENDDAEHQWQRTGAGPLEFDVWCNQCGALGTATVVLTP